MQHNRIHATLSIFSPELSESIFERIEQEGRFTTVTDNAPGDIAPTSLALLCLDTSESSDDILCITHICLLKKGQRVATSQVRLKGADLVRLPNILISNLISHVPEKFKAAAKNAFSIGYKAVPPKTGEHLLEALLALAPEQQEAINNLLDKICASSKVRYSVRSQDAAAEKDALGMCLDIFGIDRSEILSKWKPESATSASFLTGLQEYTAYEDDIISKDMHSFPGWDAVCENITGIVEFENKDGEKLTVINANRKPLEKAFGVDLIYYHRSYDAFTFVQYKMMDKQGSDSEDYYYNPNQKSHDEELTRMNKLQKALGKFPDSSRLVDYRLSRCPVFFKLCRKLQLRADDTSIAAGAYIPLDKWNILLNDDSIKGPKGGRQISYKTLRKRYIGTKTFVDLVQLGFLGTTSSSSEKIALFVEEAIKNGHSVMYAIDNRQQVI